MTTKTKPFNLFVPITRRDDEERIVEGYCYVNAQVGDGWELTRAAMEAAAPGYMQFPAIRAMHQPIAAGTCQDMTFDDKGCFIRAKIVDENEWQKCKQDVYKGFSVSGLPTVSRGKKIEQFKWIENSLVDRPKDPEAVFTLVRADGIDMEAEVEVEVLPEDEPASDVERANDAPDLPPAPEREQMIFRALATLPPGIAVAEVVDTLQRAMNGDGDGDNDGSDRPKGTTHYDCGYGGMSRSDMGETLAYTGNPNGCHGHTTLGGAMECRDGFNDQAAATKQAMINYHTKALSALTTASDVAGSTAGTARVAEAGEVARADKDSNKPYGNVEYADPGYQKDGQRRYPIDTAEHVRAAWSYINQEKNASAYSSDELGKIKGKIKSAAKKFGIEISDGGGDGDGDSAKRGEGIDMDIQQLLTRIEASETSLATVQRALEATQSDLAAAIERLGATPDPKSKPPVRFPSAIARTFAANEAAADDAQTINLLKEEYKQITTGPRPEKVTEQMAAMERVMNIKAQLKMLGAPLD